MKRASLPALQTRILGQLAQVQFATSRQLVKLCNDYASNVSTALKDLLNTGLVDGTLLTRPIIFYLTTAGGRALAVPLPSGRRHSSWSVMAHACHRNAAAEMLADKFESFKFLPRLTLLKQGFNPGHGEHGAVDGAGTAYFVLLDDYMMGSDRIPRAWTRRHAPNKKYWPDPTGRAWCEVVQRFLIVCTDETHAERHREFLKKSKLPADVLTIKPLWKY